MDSEREEIENKEEWGLMEMAQNELAAAVAAPAPIPAPIPDVGLKTGGSRVGGPKLYV